MLRSVLVVFLSIMSFAGAVLAQTTSEAHDATVREAGVSEAQVSARQPYTDLRNNWTVGVGPMRGNRLAVGGAMYGIAIGHLWDFQPQVAFKAQVEGSFATGREVGQFLNASFGPMYFLNESRTAPYLQADLGYGEATTNRSQSVDGFSVGSAVGYQFWRQNGRSADVQLRYAWITAPTDEGQPAQLGARFSVNF